MREVFVLRQLEGMRTDEVAETLRVSEAVVKTRLSRARAALRRDLFNQAGLPHPTHSASCGRDATASFTPSSHASASPALRFSLVHS